MALNGKAVTDAEARYYALAYWFQRQLRAASRPTAPHYPAADSKQARVEDGVTIGARHIVGCQTNRAPAICGSACSLRCRPLDIMTRWPPGSIGRMVISLIPWFDLHVGGRRAMHGARPHTLGREMDAEALVHIIDDDASLRDALASLFRSVGLKISSYGSARDFIDAPDRMRPDASFSTFVCPV